MNNYGVLINFKGSKIPGEHAHLPLSLIKCKQNTDSNIICYTITFYVYMYFHIIISASSSIRIFENNKIPLNFLPFFLLYVEGSLHYESLLPLSLVESVGYNILRSAIFTLSDPTSSHTPMKESILYSIFELILQMKDIMKQHHILVSYPIKCTSVWELYM